MIGGVKAGFSSNIRCARLRTSEADGLTVPSIRNFRVMIEKTMPETSEIMVDTP